MPKLLSATSLLLLFCPWTSFYMKANSPMRFFLVISPELLRCYKGKNRTQEMQHYQQPLLNSTFKHLSSAFAESGFPVAHHISSTARLHCPGCYRVQQKTYKNSYLSTFGSTLLCSACQTLI